MGILDSNFRKVSPKTGLEGTDFRQIASSEGCDVYLWEGKNGRENLRLTFRDVFAWTGGTNLYLVKGKITDDPIVIPVDDEHFPNLRKNSSNNYPAIHQVIACPATFASNSKPYGSVDNLSSSIIRINVIFENGQIYHNYPSCNDTYDFYNGKWAINNPLTAVDEYFTKFDESVVWDLPSRKHPVKTKTGNDAALIATGAYYYNPALADKCYEMHPALNQSNGYGNTIGFGATISVNPISNGENIGVRPRFWRIDMERDSANSFYFMGGYVADNKFTMVGTYRANNSNIPCRICVFGTQDGGRNWFCMYEFAGRDRVMTTYPSPADSVIGIPLSQSGSASSGIYKIRRRTIIVPNSTDKEPSTFFEYDNEKNVTSISGDSSGITFTVPSHGLINGDCVIVDFQDGVSDNNRDFDWMVNSAVNGTSGGNGVMFKVSEMTDDTFKATFYVWNPDGNLPVRHVHAINLCKDGVSVSCGETYPKGGWILYNAINAADAFSGYNVAKIDANNNNFLRLNSTNLSLQRPLGTIIRQENDGTYCYIGMDEGAIEAAEASLPVGRTGTLKHSSTGVYKVKLDGIDNLGENGKLIYSSIETCFGFQQVSNVFVFVGQYGELAIGFDYGKEWIDFRNPNGGGQGFCNFGGITYDRKFSIQNILVQLKK